MARQQQHPASGAPVITTGTRLAGHRIIPAPANDNGRSPAMRAVLAAVAIVIALAVGLLALRPFG